MSILAFLCYVLSRIALSCAVSQAPCELCLLTSSTEYPSSTMVWREWRVVIYLGIQSSGSLCAKRVAEMACVRHPCGRKYEGKNQGTEKGEAIQ